MSTLRPYQIENKIQTIAAFESGAKALIWCMPTGAGKTVSFSDFALDCIRSGRPTMIVCNRKELITQANKKLNSYGLYPALITPKHRNKISNLYLASIDTLRNRQWPEVDYLIIDEAHIRAFDPIVLYYKAKGTKIIGATATPIRYGKKFIEDNESYTGQLGDVYDRIIIPTTISELIKNEFLMPAIHYGPQPEIDFSTIKKRGTDFDEAQAFERYNKPKMYGNAIEKYKNIAVVQGKLKALCFNINVEHSIRMTAEFNAAGITSAHVDGKTKPVIRDQIFKDFETGKIQVLNNCEVATTGYDEPTIECIIINRPTMSLSLWLQMCGRGARPCFTINKTYFIIIDMGMNVDRLGYWHDERDWSLDKEFVSKKAGVAPIGDCANCGALIPLNITSCPYCSTINEKKEETERKLLEAEFVILDAGTIPQELKKPLNKMSVSELEKYRELKDYAVGWIVRLLLMRGIEALKEYAVLKNYSYSWVTKQLEIAQKPREEAKIQILQFIKSNTHVTTDTIKEYAFKKMKQNHSSDEIEVALPKILEIAKNYKEGLITIEL